MDRKKKEGKQQRGWGEEERKLRGREGFMGWGWVRFTLCGGVGNRSRKKRKERMNNVDKTLN